MVTTETKYAHIEIDDAGVPIIGGTRTKVIELVLERIAHGESPEQLREDHPYLSLGQIYSALAYYADHQQELDAEITRDFDEVNRLESETRLREATAGNPLKNRLKARGLL